MRRVLDFEEGAEPRQARFENVASPARAETGHRRNGAAVTADSTRTVRNGFKRTAAVVSLPVTPASGDEGRSECEDALPSATTENLAALAAAIPESRTTSGSESPVRQVRPAAGEAAVTECAENAGTAPAEAQHSSIPWDVLIPEALQERRFAIALRTIEKLACGSKLYEATPRLLDGTGGEMVAGDFYGPARRLGLLNPIERKLAGYAFLAQLELQHAGESAWMLVPLSADALEDGGLLTFLRTLASHPGARLAMDSLVIEFDEKDIAGRFQDVKRIGSELGKLGCNLGIRGFTATRQAEELIKTLQFVTVRLAPELIDRLADDEGLRNTLCAISDCCARSGTVVIAPGALDADAMALLYGLGVRAVESPTIGPPRLYRPRRHGKRLH